MRGRFRPRTIRRKRIPIIDSDQYLLVAGLNITKTDISKKKTVKVHIQLESFLPAWIQRLFDCFCFLLLLSDTDNSVGIAQTYPIVDVSAQMPSSGIPLLSAAARSRARLTVTLNSDMSAHRNIVCVFFVQVLGLPTG